MISSCAVLNASSDSSPAVNNSSFRLETLSAAITLGIHRIIRQTKEEKIMAIACPIDLDTEKLREEMQSVYARVATDPSGDFHFHRGPQYAAEFLNYDRAALDQLPRQSTESFAGVTNPLRIDRIAEGAVVVDIGCGAGMD